MRCLGIDPGKFGAIAILGEPAGPRVVPMPVIAGGKNGRDEFDLRAIDELLNDVASAAFNAREEIFVTVERSQPLPPKMGGTAANFARGVARGWEWMLVALSIPYQLVPPQKWQKAMHEGTPAGDTKQRSILAAQRLFPSVDLRRTERSKKPSDGVAEALLIAEYGRRTQGSKIPGVA